MRWLQMARMDESMLQCHREACTVRLGQNESLGTVWREGMDLSYSLRIGCQRHLVITTPIYECERGPCSVE